MPSGMLGGACLPLVGHTHAQPCSPAWPAGDAQAPEQFRGAASPASDAYGLGGTLLYLLSGRPPSAFPVDRMRLDLSSGVGGQDGVGVQCAQAGEKACSAGAASAHGAALSLAISPAPSQLMSSALPCAAALH